MCALWQVNIMCVVCSHVECKNCVKKRHDKMLTERCVSARCALPTVYTCTDRYSGVHTQLNQA